MTLDYVVCVLWLFDLGCSGTPSTRLRVLCLVVVLALGHSGTRRAEVKNVCCLAYSRLRALPLRRMLKLIIVIWLSLRRLSVCTVVTVVAFSR